MSEPEVFRINESTIALVFSTDGLEDVNSNTPIVIMDYSSSMEGNSYKECYKAADVLLSCVDSGHVIMFNNSAKLFQNVKTVPAIEPCGGTVFRSAFQVLEELLKQNYMGVDEPVNITIFSDGESNFPQADSVALDNLKNFILERKLQVQCNAVGIERGADSQWLLKICKMGPIHGSLSYISKQYSNDYSQETQHITDTYNKKMFEFRGKKYAVNNSFNTFFESDCTTLCAPAPLSLKIQHISHMLSSLPSRGKCSFEDLKSLKQQLDLLKNTVVEETNGVVKKRLLQQIYMTGNLLAQMVPLCTISISNEKLALLNVAARNNSRMAKKLAKRAHSVKDHFEKEAQLVKELGEQLRIKGIDAEFDSCCVITQSSAAELLEDGDCLAIGVETFAVDVCARDPSRLIFKEISDSFMSCDTVIQTSFDKAVIDDSSIEYRNLFKDGRRKYPTGALPLYISEDHWSVAKHHIRQMCGFICAGDPLQGTISMVLTVYMLGIEWIEKQPTSSFYTMIKDQWLKVLQKVQEEWPNAMPSCLKFVENVSYRTREAVHNLDVLERFWSYTNQPQEELEMALPYFNEEKTRRMFQNNMSENPNFKSSSIEEFERIIVGDIQTNVLPFADTNEGNMNGISITQYDIANAVIPGSCVPENNLRACEMIATLINSGAHSQSSSRQSKNSDVTIEEVAQMLVYELPVHVKANAELYSVISSIMEVLDLDTLERACLVYYKMLTYSSDKEWIENYVNIFSLTLAQCKSLLELYITTFINKQIQKLNNQIKAAKKNEMKDLVMSAYSQAGLVTRMLILSKYCYLGINISDFARLAQTEEEAVALSTGTVALYYDNESLNTENTEKFCVSVCVPPPYGSEEQNQLCERSDIGLLKIKTVKDIEKYVGPVEGSPCPFDLAYHGVWLPNTKNIWKLHPTVRNKLLSLKKTQFTQKIL